MEPITGAPASTVTRTLTSDSNTATPPTPNPMSRLSPHNHLTHHPHAPSQTDEISYNECLKNHAASSGGHALDGCCEFMPGKTSLTCGACGCHRNFHRRDPDDPAPLHACVVHSPVSDEIVGGYRKRFRTRFSQEQREKMEEFAEAIGWRLRRGEDGLVDEFCKKVGIRRGVFKVWMSNNKNNRNRQLHLHLHRESNNNGNCVPLVVYHQFYANGHGAQQAQ